MENKKNTYRPLTGIARNAGIPKSQMESALIDAFRLLCGAETDLMAINIHDETGHSARLLDEIEEFLRNHYELLAPVVNEILQKEYNPKNFDDFKLEWDNFFPAFPLTYQRTYTVSVRKNPAPLASDMDTEEKEPLW